MPRNTITPAVSRPSRVPVSIVTRGGAAARAAPSAARIAAPIKNGRLGTPNDAVARCELQRTTTRELQTDDYRPGADGVSAVGLGRAGSCARAGAGGVRSAPERHFRSAYNIFRTRIVWVTSERKSFSEMALVSRASMRWYSNSELEFSAYFRNRANSFSLSCRLPSAMFAGIDVAARKS